MCVYSLSVLRVCVAERDSVAGIVAPEEKPREEKQPHEQISYSITFHVSIHAVCVEV